jgi:hypothetical protein
MEDANCLSNQRKYSYFKTFYRPGNVFIMQIVIKTGPHFKKFQK